MALYLIGDLQGCYAPFQRLLETIDYSPSRDTIYCLGDLVNRGPDSLGVLRHLMGLGTSAHCLLGNHDLHLLAVAQGVRKAHRNDTLDGILNAPDRNDLLQWLRQRPLAMHVQGWLLVHAGVLPQWTAAKTLELADEVRQMLSGTDGPGFLQTLYGNLPNQWDGALQGADRWRLVINALTRLRFCNAEGVMEFATKDSTAAAPAGCMPWFDVPGRCSANTPIAFGHWSTLGLLQSSNLLGMDTGCVWGGCLSAAQISGTSQHGQTGSVTVIQVPCPQAQVPGA